MSVRIGRPRSPPTPKTQSVYGPHLTPSLVGAGLTHSLMLHHFQLMICLASFMKKIADIRRDTAHSIPPVFHPTECKLSTLNAVTSAELRCIILTSPPKSCELDPISTFLLQELAERSI